LTKTDDESTSSDMLVNHLLGAKKKHDEDKNVEKEEVEHLDKGTDYLVSFLVGQGVQVSEPKSNKTKTSWIRGTEEKIC